MELVNIPATVCDHSFRYTRPRSLIKQRPINGGITEISNFGLITYALGRTNKDLTTYIKKKLGCRGKVHDDDKTMELSGLYPCDVIEQQIEMFIHEDVLCPRCNNPETTKTMKKKKIQYVCRACGFTHQ